MFSLRVFSAVVKVVEKEGDTEKIYWHRLGTAYQTPDNKVKVKLNSLPVGHEGVVEFFLFPEVKK